MLETPPSETALLDTFAVLFVMIVLNDLKFSFKIVVTLNILKVYFILFVSALYYSHVTVYHSCILCLLAGMKVVGRHVQIPVGQGHRLGLSCV